MQKRIIIFTDLEGTILRESDSSIDKVAMQNLLYQLQQLQKNIGATINIHIVSPMSPLNMETRIDEIDREIKKNRFEAMGKKGEELLDYVSVGACSNDEAEFAIVKDRRVMPLPSHKVDYVKAWKGMLDDKFDVMKYIYLGNDTNDFYAMQYVKKLDNGITICPGNSNPQIKEVSTYVGDSTDAAGCVEAFEQLNADLIKQNSKNIDLQKQDATEEKDR